MYKYLLGCIITILICTTSFAQTYYYSYSGYSKETFNWPGMTKQQTNALIQEAFTEVNKHSKMQVKPWSGKGAYQFTIKFSNKIPYNALAVMDGSTMLISTTRPVKPVNCRSVVIHEFFHYLKYKANPSADKWGHSPDKNCAFNINGNIDKLCPAEINFLVSKFGKK